MSGSGSFLHLAGTSRLVAAAAMLVTAVTTADAAPLVYVPGDTRNVRVEFEGIVTGPEGVDVRLFKTGKLMTVNEAKPMAPREGCAAGQRLVLTGTTLVARDTRGQLAAWYNETIQGRPVRKSGSIILQDREGGELRSYNFLDCFPTSYRTNGGVDDDCDGTVDESLVTVELSVGAVEVVARGAKAAPGNPAEGSWTVEIDGCVSAGACPGRDTDEVSVATLEVDASSALPGGTATLLESAGTLRLKIRDSDQSDALSTWMLRAQADPVVSGIVRATVNTTRSNIRSPRKSAGGGGAGGSLVLIAARILSVELPTFDLDPKSPAPASHGVEKIEIAVEKIERG